MARSTFKTLFCLKKNNLKEGKTPVMGRITVNGTIAQFSCKLNVKPDLWDTKANKNNRQKSRSTKDQAEIRQHQNPNWQAVPTYLQQRQLCLC